MALTSLNHYLDAEWMRYAYECTRKDGAVGVDGQTAEAYALNGPHPFRWTVSNLSFRPLIFIQRIPQRGLPPQAAEVQWLIFFFSFAWH
jgi:hypothetical protein